MQNSILTVGTRGSRLALAQARAIAKALGGEKGGVRIEVLRTRGDRWLEMPLKDAPEKGLFTRELEVALTDGRIDVAVHSLKDLPTAPPPGLVLGAVPPRVSAGDVLLVRPGGYSIEKGWLELAPGGRVGTASPRREALSRHFAPSQSVELLRGNVPTRVEKCIEGQYDAIVLARAGLERLQLNPSPLIAFDLDPRHWIPAPGQGALGLQCREEDGDTRMRLAALECDRSRLAVSVERRILQLSEAGCHAPLGAHLVFRNGGAELNAGTQSVAGAWVAITRSEGMERVDGLGDQAFELLRSARDEVQPAPVVRPEKGIGPIASPAEAWWEEQTG